ncbi:MULTISPECIES: flavin reductase family protein [unclassified Streptomyces]|uniref:flavin reductase family protein n=1 Tax=unclassified Streptomyces TaxID=2593676 RepID=UPI00362DE8F9
MAGLDAFTALLDHPLCVVTTAAPDGERAGCLVGFASSCSLRPPRFVAWLSRENHTYRVACRGEFLAVHALGPGQRETARLFGEETGDRVDKFARASFSPSAYGGVPVLADCVAWFVGRVEARLDGGDHVGFLLSPVSESPPGDPDAGLIRLSDAVDFTPGHPA